MQSKNWRQQDTFGEHNEQDPPIVAQGAPSTASGLLEQDSAGPRPDPSGQPPTVPPLPPVVPLLVVPALPPIEPPAPGLLVAVETLPVAPPPPSSSGQRPVSTTGNPLPS